MAEVNRDLFHFPISYFFHGRDPRLDRSVALPGALERGRRLADSSPDPAVRFYVRGLITSIDELAGAATEPADAEEVFRRWRVDHLREAEPAGHSRR